MSVDIQTVRRVARLARIAVSEGAEAAQPFRPLDKPIDAYNAAILDAVDIR